MMVYLSDSQCNQILDSMKLGLMIRSFSACDALSIQHLPAKVGWKLSWVGREPLRFSSFLKAWPWH